MESPQQSSPMVGKRVLQGMPIQIVTKLQSHPVRDSNPRSYSWQARTLTITPRRNTRDGDKLIYLSFSGTIALVAPSSGVKINQGQNTCFKVVEMRNR
ncbi:hypothetical protein AVEN_113679-1 [Araneus ventricosus]|uniref:Uncharacterized protein n=1 Tax=Araneus ventricosus TaxID=182803 RepID=A0A4Y2NF56_ARAVE|nr:hypothetical protein AVEN_113679-1 [Araneus ventricosus]